jgi:hypothetical protein
MGSGEFSTAGYGYASYVREPMFRDLLFAPWYPDDDPRFTYMKPQDDACYLRSALTTSADPWNRFFYLGGPGGDAAGCD